MTSDIQNSVKDDATLCPRCLQPEGVPMEASGDRESADHYRCESCGQVWTVKPLKLARNSPSELFPKVVRNRD
jgi:transposase-like protein